MLSTLLSRRNLGTRELTLVPEREYFESAPLFSSGCTIVPPQLCFPVPRCKGIRRIEHLFVGSYVCQI
jgi:hypothetical protein